MGPLAAIKTSPPYLCTATSASIAGGVRDSGELVAWTRHAHTCPHIVNPPDGDLDEIESGRMHLLVLTYDTHLATWAKAIKYTGQAKQVLGIQMPDIGCLEDETVGKWFPANLDDPLGWFETDASFDEEH